ncbi:MAG: triple tyrosine motif-containing protein, partial [Bacteroidota bacterium]
MRLLDRQNNAYPAYTVEAGLPSNIVKSIEESADGYLWLGTTQGLVRFDPDSLSYKRYTVGDGLQGLYFNQDAAARLSSGELVFGGTEGFNLFHPDSLQERSQKSPIAFTNFEIFNRPVPVGEEDSPLNKQINYTESINLSYKYSVFSISYTSINFSSPNLIRYRYRLLGFTDDSWQRVGSERKVTYTNLQPGQYTFEVRGQLSDQMTPTRSIAIIVTPPWWRTWWFYIITGGTFLILLYAVYWIRAQQIIRANRKLGALVDERT